MLGSIIGNIIGSPYERSVVKTTEFDLFSENSCFTCDAVMTIAVAEALRRGGERESYIAAMRKYGKKYSHVGYGKGFASWLNSKKPRPYNSFGNGSAMRVSPVAWWFDTLEEVEKGAEVSAAVTHNHPEGIKGAQATAAAIFLARKGKNKTAIREYIENRYGYDLSRKLDKIRLTYRFDASCQKTVPEAITAFLESDGFEDAIRKVVSLGGDSDTLAAITGGIAEAAYGIPEEIKEQALPMLDHTLRFAYLCWKIEMKDKYEKNFDWGGIENILIESIFNETLPGLTNYVRDVNLPDNIADQYTEGLIIVEPELCSASRRVMGMITTHRFAILSNHMADFGPFEQGTNWGLHVAPTASYFKVLGSYTHNGKKLIMLLHLPDGAWKSFRNATSNLETQLKDMTIESFVNKCDAEPVPELTTEAWLARCSNPVGMKQDGKFYELESPDIKRMEFLKDSLKIGERPKGAMKGLPGVVLLADILSASARS
jgi:ADP-ribosylglycohydrolase